MISRYWKVGDRGLAGAGCGLADLQAAADRTTVVAGADDLMRPVNRRRIADLMSSIPFRPATLNGCAIEAMFTVSLTAQ